MKVGLVRPVTVRLTSPSGFLQAIRCLATHGNDRSWSQGDSVEGPVNVCFLVFIRRLESEELALCGKRKGAAGNDDPLREDGELT
jgi:hypothetical protein